MKLWLLTTNHQALRVFGAGFRRASRFGAEKILAILCRAKSPDFTKDLCKVLLGLEATSNGHVQYCSIGNTQHRLYVIRQPLTNRSACSVMIEVDARSEHRTITFSSQQLPNRLRSDMESIRS
jgi:hypothetical protein